MKSLRTRTVPAARQGGFSFLEMMIAMAVLSTILLSIAFTFERTAGSYEDGQVDRALDAQVHRTLNFIVAEFFDAGQIAAAPLAPLGASAITYRRPLAFNASNVVWGDFLTIELEFEVGELDDGIDNNDNGLADERVAVWIENKGQPDERRKVLTHWVRELLEGETNNAADDNGNGLEDEGGLSFELEGDFLNVRLTLERLDDRGRRVVKTAETSVRLRN